MLTSVSWLDNVEPAAQREQRLSREAHQAADRAAQYAGWMAQLAREVALVPAALQKAGKRPALLVTTRWSKARGFTGWLFAQPNVFTHLDHQAAISEDGRFYRLRVKEERGGGYSGRHVQWFEGADPISEQEAAEKFFELRRQEFIENGQLRDGLIPATEVGGKPMGELYVEGWSHGPRTMSDYLVAWVNQQT